jgi:L-asparaginase II
MGLVAAGLIGIVATGVVIVSGAPVAAAVAATVGVGLAVTYACKRGMNTAREAVAAELKQSKQSESQLEKIMKEA